MGSFVKTDTAPHSRQKKNRFQRLVASFAVTGVVVGAAIAHDWQPIEAEFQVLEAYGTSIYFETYVRDTDDRLIEDSLKIVIDNNDEHHEISIEKGLYSGHYFGLSPHTEYRISIRGDEGSGEIIYHEQTITTYEDIHFNLPNSYSSDRFTQNINITEERFTLYAYTKQRRINDAC